MFEHILTKRALEKSYFKERLAKAAIARKFSTTVSTVLKYMRRYEIPNRSIADFKGLDLTKKRFGRLTALRRGPSDFHKKSSWICSCSCGKEKVIASASLLRGLSKSCGCLRSELAHKGYKDISSSQWRRLEDNAANRGYEFNISPIYVWKIYEKQKRKCALTGLDIKFTHDSNKPYELTASVDRIDSRKGYIRGNIQLVHKTVNLMKSWLPEEEFVAICNLVSYRRPVNYEDCINRTSRTILRKV